VKASIGNEKFQILDLMLAEDGIANTYGVFFFADGTIASATVIDAQLNYNLPSLKST
jgi:hypothetical protein